MEGRKYFREPGTLEDISRGAFFDLGGCVCGLSNLEEGIGGLNVGFEDFGGPEVEGFASER